MDRKDAICLFYWLVDREDPVCSPSPPLPAAPPLPIYPDGRLPDGVRAQLQAEFEQDGTAQAVLLDQTSLCTLMPHLLHPSACTQSNRAFANWWLPPQNDAAIIAHDGWIPVDSMHDGMHDSTDMAALATLLIWKLSAMMVLFAMMVLTMQRVSSVRRRRHPLLLAQRRPEPQESGYGRLRETE
jgi:hypothetical protein